MLAEDLLPCAGPTCTTTRVRDQRAECLTDSLLRHLANRNNSNVYIKWHSDGWGGPWQCQVWQDQQPEDSLWHSPRQSWWIFSFWRPETFDGNDLSFKSNDVRPNELWISYAKFEQCNCIRKVVAYQTDTVGLVEMNLSSTVLNETVSPWSEWSRPFLSLLQ